MYKLMSMALATALLSSSCSSEKIDQRSDSNFARYHKVDGSILHMVDMIHHSKLKEDRICFNLNDQLEMSPDEVILETKLSLTMWLKLSGYKNLTALDEVQFTNDCTDEEKSGAFAIVSVPDISEVKNDPNMANRFHAPKATCHYNWGVSCQGQGVVLAFASMVAGWQYPTRNGSVFKIYQAAPITFNPYIKWSNLKADFEKYNDQELISIYDLLMMNKDFSVRHLETLADKMFERSYISKTNTGLSDVMNQAMNEKRTIEAEYTPNYTMFSTMLHEVGHALGLHHADNPVGQVVTGDESGQEFTSQVYRTKDAVMAYGDRFLYLTKDDTAGIRSIANELNLELIEDGLENENPEAGETPEEDPEVQEEPKEDQNENPVDEDAQAGNPVSE